LIFRYLPLTDLPQHLAILSILKNGSDPQYQFSDYYISTLGQTLYLMPYLLAWAISTCCSLDLAQRLTVVLAMLSLPVGVWSLLRLQNKPAWIGLMALPFVVNHTLSWGFIGFNLGLGIALLAVSALLDPARTWRGSLAVIVLSLAALSTHLYGLAVLLGLGGLGIVLSRETGPRVWFQRGWPLIPAVVGTAAWFAMMHSGNSLGARSENYPSLLLRWKNFDDTLLSWPDRWEEPFLVALLLLWLWSVRSSLPWTLARWRQATDVERAIYGFSLVNLLLYQILPDDVSGIYCVLMRHSVLAVCFLPLATTTAIFEDRPRLAPALLALLALVTVTLSTVQWAQFDQEARSFDGVLSKFPEAPRVVGLIWDNQGRSGRNHPFLHFPAYVQAHKGGLVALSFPRYNYHLPVRERPGADIPKSPQVLDWDPNLYNFRTFGYYYDYVLVKTWDNGRAPIDDWTEFPYTLILQQPPWRVYRVEPAARTALLQQAPRQ